jgi:hypothetical protein
MKREGSERFAKSELIDLSLGLRRPNKLSETVSKPPSTGRLEKPLVRSGLN